VITRNSVQALLALVTDDADFEEFEKHMAADFYYEFMGTQPYAGKWIGADGVRRQFEEFTKNFESPFRVSVSDFSVDAEARIAAVRLHSYPLTDLGGGDYRQHCVWFLYFTEDDKVAKIVDYSDTKLVDEMIVRVATARMAALQGG
jgi:ketosteroid isomerase-like protein